MHQIVGETDPHALSRGGKVNRSLVALVAVLAQQQTLGAELHALRFPGATGHGRLPALLVLDRPDPFSIALDQIDDCSEVQRLARQMDRTLMQRGPRAFRLGNAPVYPVALDGIAALLPFALDPFEPRKPRAIDELVQHTRGDQAGNARVVTPVAPNFRLHEAPPRREGISGGCQNPSADNRLPTAAWRASRSLVTVCQTRSRST